MAPGLRVIGQRLQQAADQGQDHHPPFRGVDVLLVEALQNFVHQGTDPFRQLHFPGIFFAFAHELNPCFKPDPGPKIWLKVPYSGGNCKFAAASL